MAIEPSRSAREPHARRCSDVPAILRAQRVKRRTSRVLTTKAARSSNFRRSLVCRVLPDAGKVRRMTPCAEERTSIAESAAHSARRPAMRVIAVVVGRRSASVVVTLRRRTAGNSARTMHPIAARRNIGLLRRERRDGEARERHERSGCRARSAAIVSSLDER